MKYLVDTSVLVEALRPRPTKAVVDWLFLQSFDGLATSALAVAELEAGVGGLPPGAQRNGLTDWLLRLKDFFKAGVFPFDAEAARPCARLMAQATAAGHPVLLGDAMMAGIAESNGMVLAAYPSPLLRLWGGPMVDPWSGG